MSPAFRSYSLLVLQALVVFGVYFFTARWGLGLNAVSGFAALIWPPTGIALAAVFLFGYRIAPTITLAAFLVNYLTGAPVLAALAIAVGNTLEPVVGAWLLHSFRFNPLFSRLIDSLVFILVAISVSVISATIGTTALGLTNILSASDAPLTWLAWWTGDTIGALVLAPFLIRWLTPSVGPRRSLAQFFEAAAFFVTLIVFTLLVFWEPIPGLRGVTLPYMIFVPLTWGALRVGPRVMTSAIATVAAIATTGTLMGAGPFAPIQTGQELFLLQLFLSTVAFIFLLFVTAVEERKEATKRLEESVVSLKEDVQTISEADQAKNDFIATLSHELRNPLAPILSSLEIIKTGRVEKNEMQALLDTTHENVMRMARLLDDLLDVARISRKKFTLQMGVVGLRSVVERATTMAKPIMQKYGHSFSVHLPPDDIRLDADQLRIEQVVINLLNNAAKYTPHGGTISLHATGREGGQPAQAGAEICVRDNGTGIPPHELEKIFEPFKQLTNGRRAESAGLGIGLSLAKRLVELHGGTISAKSKGPGTGSEFVVWLPAAKPVILLPAQAILPSEEKPRTEEAGSGPSRKPHEMAASPISRGKTKKKVLIVDDNEDAARGIARLLNGSGHEALSAQGGAEALTTLARFRPDVIFLDIGLPGESGYDLAQTIRSYLDPSPAIVALTGYGQEEDKQRALEAGFDGFLTKPVSIADLEKILANSERAFSS